LAFGASLVGLELHAQDLARDAFDVIDGFGHFDAAAFATAASVDLGFDHPHWTAQFLCGFDSLLNRERRNATGNWHTELTQDFLALVLVNLHEVFSQRVVD
jgi:hypothetical protein